MPTTRIMKFRFPRLFLAACCLLPAGYGAPSALAAGHPEISIVPLGQGFVPNGASDQSYRLPAGPTGPHSQALVLVASQPMAAVNLPAPLAADPQAVEEHKEKVPATVTLKVADRQLPAWQLYKFPTMYIVNLETLRANPEYAKGRVAIRFEVDTLAEGVSLRAFGMPDPLLVSDSLDGPLSLFHEAASDDDTRALMEALAQEAAGNKAMARATYLQLSSAADEKIARMARRGLRMLSYDERPHKLSGNFREHYYWGMYLQQTGVFASAYKEFDEARVIYRMHADAQYRAGETLDQIGGDIFRVMDFMNAAGEAAWESQRTNWSSLLVVLKGKDHRRLSSEELLELKVSWFLMRSMVWGATAGKVLPVGKVLEIDDESEWPLIDYGDGLMAPTRDIVAERGWFDSVFFIRPRMDGDTGPAVRTVGGDVGPNGAGLSVLYHDASWQDFMLAWYQHFIWAARAGEVSEALPLPEEVHDCGYQPATNIGYSIRAALRYDIPPEVLRRVQMTARPGPKEFVRMWQLEGPFPKSSLAEDVSENWYEPLPSTTGDQKRRLVSRSDYIDLTRLYPDSGPALLRATTWVYSPMDQEVRMWLGRNHRAAVWVNGRLIHSGKLAASALDDAKHPVDRVAGYAPLRTGWNEVRMVVASPSEPSRRGWGFSLRFSTLSNQPVPGMAYLHSPPSEHLAVASSPEVGPHYNWGQVRRNWLVMLPRLGETELRQITGLSNLTLKGKAGPGGGVVLSAGAEGQRGRYREMNSEWQRNQDRDVVLNNVLDWDRESCAAIRYERNGLRDLLLVKPEAMMPYLKLLREPAAAAALYGDTSPYERVLGYVVIPTSGSARYLFVVDCLMGEADQWPLDEEDLLNPIAAEYIPNPPRMLPVYSPPAATQ